MNRKSRNITCFFIGVLIAFFFALPSFAGAVKVQPKTWYGNNTGGVTKGFTGSSPPKVWSSNDGVWSPPTYKSNGSFKKNGMDVPFSANQDFYSPDLYPAVKDAVKGGFKGLAKGGLGLGPILGGLALTWAMQQGFNWMDQAKCAAQVECWQKTTTHPEFYTATQDLRVEAKTLPSRTRLKIYPNTKCCTPQIYADLDGWCKQYGYAGSHPTVKTACATKSFGSVDYFFNLDLIGSATPNGAIPSSVAPVSVATVETAVKAAVDQNFPQWFQAAVDDNMMFEVDDTRPVVPVETQPVVAPATVTTSSETNPDGSTVLRTQTAADTYTARCIVGVDGACTALDPWQVTEGKTVTEQTTTCTAAGTCETAVKTEEQTSQEPAPETDPCKANPASVGCMDLGELPEDEDLPKQEQRLEFSWTPFALPNTCPAPEQIELMGQVHEYDWSLTCDFAQRIRPFVLLSAFLAAYFIVMGIKRNESN